MSLTFPVVGFHRDVGPYAEAGREKVVYYLDPEDFSTSTSWELRRGQRSGMVVVGRDLQCWKVVRVTDLGVIRPFWERLFRLLVRQTLHRVDQQVEPIEPMTLDQVKERVVASIYANPDDWRDDDAIAGVDGPPREEQELLDELADGVRAAASLPQIINSLFDERIED